MSCLPAENDVDTSGYKRITKGYLSLFLIQKQWCGVLNHIDVMMIHIDISDALKHSSLFPFLQILV